MSRKQGGNHNEQRTQQRTFQTDSSRAGIGAMVYRSRALCLGAGAMAMARAFHRRRIILLWASDILLTKLRPPCVYF
jgi:hypothetical protein